MVVLSTRDNIVAFTLHAVTGEDTTVIEKCVIFFRVVVLHCASQCICCGTYVTWCHVMSCVTDSAQCEWAINSTAAKSLLAGYI